MNRRTGLSPKGNQQRGNIVIPRDLQPLFPSEKSPQGRQAIPWYSGTLDLCESHKRFADARNEYDKMFAQMRAARNDEKQLAELRLRIQFEGALKKRDHASAQQVLSSLCSMHDVSPRIIVLAHGSLDQAFAAPQRGLQTVQHDEATNPPSMPQQPSPGVQAVRETAGLKPAERIPFTFHLNDMIKVAASTGSPNKAIMSSIKSHTNQFERFLLSLPGQPGMAEMNQIDSRKYTTLWMQKCAEKNPATGKQDREGTNEQRLATCGRYWRWGAKTYPNEFRQPMMKTDHPFMGVDFTGRAARIVKAYTPKEVRRIYTEALRRSKLPNQPGDEKARYREVAQSILIAAYTGMRLASIVALARSWLNEERSIRYIHVPKAKGKTAAGARDIPIHQVTDAMFAELERNAGPNGRLFRLAGDRGSEWRRCLRSILADLDIYDPNPADEDIQDAEDQDDAKISPYHSLRRSFNQRMGPTDEGQERVLLEVQQYLMGHKCKNRTRGWEEGQYGARPPLPMLNAAIKVIEYPGITAPTQKGRTTRPAQPSPRKSAPAHQARS